MELANVELDLDPIVAGVQSGLGLVPAVVPPSEPRLHRVEKTLKDTIEDKEIGGGLFCSQVF
ncbi:hypothetical protein E2562_036942 [Oryza meyeriana var. granulata]|uniref:Uncharacterized protein n=1 Tax=Oryza meyeriana var. granulata TaxID=110450 RepID=A0A6G1CBB8_9ORYZ|nr:hypothetical protein E2562_036942 [Oryza meyeriana var. granulata]